MWNTIEYLGLALVPAFIVLGLVMKARSFETPRFWRFRATVVSALTLALSVLVTLFWAGLFDGFSLVDGSKLGIAGGALAGILAYEFVHYWYHRAAHTSKILWRWAHQMHHSAESVDAFSALYAHPLDTFFFSSWPSLVFFPLLGLRPEAGVLAGVFLTFNTMFQHANINTPRWLGYIIQRPESHSVHHERGWHRSNYSDLPLWDMVFGTFENPPTFEGEAGFYNGASTRILPMLFGCDISNPPDSDDPIDFRRAA